jgi:hypothetical protein
VAVRVDEAWWQRASAQLDFSCTGTGEGTNLRGTADGDGFDDVVLHIDGVDLSAGEDNFCAATLMMPKAAGGPCLRKRDIELQRRARGHNRS